MRKWISFALLALAATGCSFSRDGSRLITVRLPSPGAQANPDRPQVGPSIETFGCYVVQVFGPGLPAGCPAPLTTPLISSSQATVQMRVPSGPARRIQVLGVDAGAAGCPVGTPYSLYLAQNPSSPPSLYLLGEAISDLFTDTAITVRSTYNASTAQPIAPAGCLDGGRNHFVYTSNQSGNSISIFRYDPVTHAMAPVNTNFAHANLSAPTALASGGQGRFLFVANTGSTRISTFSIDAMSGQLTFVSDSAPGDAYRHMISDPMRPYLYTTSGASPNVRSWSYSPAGTVTNITTQTFMAAGTAGGIALAPGGQALFVTDSTNDEINVFPVANGNLSARSPTSQNDVGPMAIHPSGRFLFAVSGGASPSSYAYTLDSTTAAITGASVQASMTGMSAARLSPLGRFLWVASSGGSIRGFSVNQTTGALSELSGSPWTSSMANIIDMVGDPLGTQLFAINFTSNELRQFNHGVDSGVVDVPGGLTSVGGGPTSVLVVGVPKPAISPVPSPTPAI
jgi:6-phosphogluconolactonase (cycloisomerase 2 family)